MTGCGPEDKVVQRQTGPTVDVSSVDPKDIKPVPQAPEFTGVPKEVAASVDRIVVAFNTGDAKYLCTAAYTKSDIEALNKAEKNGCVKSFEQFFELFDGYRMTIKEIEVNGGSASVKADALTTDLRDPDKAINQPLQFEMVKEDGQWRMSINAEQSMTQQSQATEETGDPESDRSDRPVP
jgi:hypothetical protein